MQSYLSEWVSLVPTTIYLNVKHGDRDVGTNESAINGQNCATVSEKHVNLVQTGLSCVTVVVR